MFPSIGTLGAVVLGGALGVASVGIAFAVGMRRAVLAIFLVRSSCDPVFGLAQAESGGMGPGAAVNVLVIVLALLFCLESSVLISSAILPWTGFLMTALASAIGSPEPMMKALRGFFVLTSYAAVFALPFALIRSRQWALRCLTVVMCSSIIPVTYAFVEIASGTAGGDRLRSTFGHIRVLPSQPTRFDPVPAPVKSGTQIATCKALVGALSADYNRSTFTYRVAWCMGQWRDCIDRLRQHY